jgi:hypothetical protein
MLHPGRKLTDLTLLQRQQKIALWIGSPRILATRPI